MSNISMENSVRHTERLRRKKCFRNNSNSRIIYDLWTAIFWLCFLDYTHTRAHTLTHAITMRFSCSSIWYAWTHTRKTSQLSVCRATALPCYSFYVACCWILFMNFELWTLISRKRVSEWFWNRTAKIANILFHYIFDFHKNLSRDKSLMSGNGAFTATLHMRSM